MDELSKYGSKSIALGEVIPKSPHSVFCSLPTIANIRSYETKEEAICNKMQGGYPRFVNPSLTRKLENILEKKFQNIHKSNKNKKIRLVSSEAMAQRLCENLAKTAEAEVFSEFDGTVFGVSFLDENDYKTKAHLFLQHTGAMIYSREAEEILISFGLEKTRHSEEGLDYPPATSQQKIKASLCRELKTTAESIYLNRSGMSAFFASYLAVSELQKKRGRTIWIQLGWLYVDTMEILKKFSASEEEYIYIPNIQNLSDLQNILSIHSSKIAGLVTETPTNPLVSTLDLKTLSKICRQHEIPLLVDPSLSGTYNLDVLEYSDITLASLTKYYGWFGDLIMGFLALNTNSQYYAELSELVPKYIEAPFRRDLQRLAYLIEDYPKVMKAINQNTMLFAEFLTKHPRIKKLNWAYSKDSAKNYSAIAKEKDSPGGVLSFELDCEFSSFYDNITMPKGPSFGTAFHILCPFIYLAHYDLVKNAHGRTILEKNGINPELLRLSIGTENIETLCLIFEKALAKH